MRHSLITERPLLERAAEYRPAVPSTLEAVHIELDKFWTHVNSALVSPIANRWKLEFSTAFLEICANIIKHAFAESAPSGTMVIHLSLYKNRIEAEFTDDGALFDDSSSSVDPIPTLDAGLPESGRGLQVARALLTTLRYRRSQESRNHWLLVKMLP